MSEYRVSWEQAARRLGEDLSSDGPNGYGSFTPAQWLQWARGAVAGWKQRDAQWQHKWSRAVGTGTSNTLREADRADAAEARLKALEQQILRDFPRGRDSYRRGVYLLCTRGDLTYTTRPSRRGLVERVYRAAEGR